jgi:hypothetical protein
VGETLPFAEARPPWKAAMPIQKNRLRPGKPGKACGRSVDGSFDLRQLRGMANP